MDKIQRSPTEHLAYRLQPGSPTVVYLGGFRSDMQGTKALHFERLAKAHGLGSLCFDYSGHGQSGGSFREKTVADWLNDALSLIDHRTKGPLILVGSSMGGWLMLHLALARPERVVGLLGIASAPDFVERLIWSQMEDRHKDLLQKQGELEIPELGVVLSAEFFEHGLAHSLLDKPLPIGCPLRLVHGTHDKAVPWTLSLEILEKAASSAAQLVLIKNGCHRLNEPRDLVQLTAVFEELLPLSLSLL